MQIHEVQPVQFGGSPMAIASKSAVSPQLHQGLLSTKKLGAVQDFVSFC